MKNYKYNGYSHNYPKGNYSTFSREIKIAFLFHSNCEKH